MYSEIKAQYEDFKIHESRVMKHGYETRLHRASASLHSGVSKTAYGIPLEKECVVLSGGGNLMSVVTLDNINRRYFLKLNCALEKWEIRYNNVKIKVNGKTLHKVEKEFIEIICQGWPSLYYDIPDEYLSSGENIIEIITKDSSNAGFLFGDVSILSLPQKKAYNQLSCQRSVRAGKRFTVAIQADETFKSEHVKVRTEEGCSFRATEFLGNIAFLHFDAILTGQTGCYVQLSEKSEWVSMTLPEVVKESEDSCLVGMDSDDHRHDMSSEADRVLEVFAMTGMGDFVQFRPSTGRTHLVFAPLEVWGKRIGLLKQMEISIGIADTRSHLMSFIPELAGEKYVGCHIHEPYLYFCLPIAKTKNKNTFMVNPVDVLKSESFGESEALYRSVLKKTLEKNKDLAGLSSVGSPSLLCVYEAAEEFDRVTLEPVSNINMLTAAGRGSISQNIQWGAHVPVDWYFGSPNSSCKSRKFRLAMNYLYMSGARYIYTENAVFKTNAFSREDWEDEFCSVNREYLRDFYDYVTRNPREGKLVVNKAVIYGRHEHFLWYHDDRMAELKDVADWDCKVWGKWGDDSYRKSWRALDAWLPAASEQYECEAPENLKLFSGTPYGDADIIPWEGDYRKYKTLAILGWNTMCKGMLEKMMDYVRDGGTLFFSCCHLNETDRNDKPMVFIKHDGLEDFIGAELQERYTCDGEISFNDGFKTEKAKHSLNIMKCKELSAKAIAWDPKGESVCFENKYGKGTVYFGAFSDYPAVDWAIEVTRHVMNILGDKGGITCDNTNIAFTQREQDDGSNIIDVVNMNCAVENGMESFTMKIGEKNLTDSIYEGRIYSYHLV